MKVSERKIIESFCDKLDFNKCKTNFLHYKKDYKNNFTINLVCFCVIIGKRDLVKNTILITNKDYKGLKKLYTTMLKHAAKKNNNKVIYVKDLGAYGDKYNLHYLIKDIKNGGEDIEFKVNNLINFLEYFNIDKKSKEYKEAVILIDKYKKNKGE